MFFFHDFTSGFGTNNDGFVISEHLNQTKGRLNNQTVNIIIVELGNIVIFVTAEAVVDVEIFIDDGDHLLRFSWKV
jgi:hypothetical protein